MAKTTKKSARKAGGKASGRAPKAAPATGDTEPADGATITSKLAEIQARLVLAGEQLRKTASEVRADPRYKIAADAALSGLHGAAASLRGLVEKVEHDLNERRPHATGERVGGGRYDCRACGTSVILTSPRALPACAGCGGRKFRLAS